MSAENLEFVKGVYAEWAKGNFQAGTAAYDENVVFVMPPEFADSGVYTGREALRGYMRAFLEPWKTMTIEGTELRDVGDSVLARVVQRGVGRLSGAATELVYYHVWTLRGGKVIRLDVIPDEQEALEAVGVSKEDDVGDPRKDSSENVEIVHRIWEAWERREPEMVFALYDPEIVWETHGDPTYGASLVDGRYHGHEGLRQFFAYWRDSFDNWQAHAETFIDAGDKVVVGYRASGRGKSSGIEVGNRVFWLVYTLRDGLVVRIDLFGNEAQALEAAGADG